MRRALLLLLCCLSSTSFGQVGGFVRPFVNTGGGSPPAAPLDLLPLVATSGSSVTADQTPVTGNAITVPTGYNAVAVYFPNQPLSRGLLRLHVKVDSTTTPCDIYPYGHVIVKAAAGTVVAFGAQNRAKTTLSLSNATEEIVVIPYKMPATLTPPAGVTVTVTPNQSFPGLWFATSANLKLPGECSCFQVEPSSTRRDIFVSEYGGGANIIPTRHVHLPAGQAVRVQCRYKLIAIMSISGEPLTITGNRGTVAGNLVSRWEPDFVPNAETTVSTVAALKTAMNGNTYDDILLAPGVYDTSASGDLINPTNYSAAMARNIRIRSSTGNPADVVFTGAGWDVSLGSGITWILQGVSWSLDGVAPPTGKLAMLLFCGNVHLCDFAYYGATSSGSNVSSITWEARTSTGPTTSYAAWGSITKSKRDGLASNSYNSQACTVNAIGCTIDGNGTGSGDQLVTAGTGGTMACWGCRLKDGATGNVARVASDASTTPVYLNFCFTRQGDIGHATGLEINNAIFGTNPSGVCIHSCDFDRVGGINFVRYVVGSRATSVLSNGPLLNAQSSTIIAGCDLYGNTAQSASGYEKIINGYQSDISIFGTRLTHHFTFANQHLLDMNGNNSGNKVATLRNVLFRSPTTVANSFCVNVDSNGGGGTHSIDFKNVLVDDDGSMQISSTTAASLSDGCRFKRASAPTNWASKVTAGTNTFSASALDLSATDTPTPAGNCDAGIDPGFVGGIDIYGRPFLGGTFVMGCVERQEIRNGQVLYPAIW